MKRVLNLFFLPVSCCLTLLAADPVPQVTPPPMPPPRSSPIQIFRDLLSTNEAGRAALLERRPAEQRQLIQSKLDEYLTLSAEQREARLLLTELRWYFLEILQRPATERTSFLAHVPDKFRPLLLERLKIWDSLSAAEQVYIEENESAMAYIIRMESVPPPQSRAMLTALPPEKRRQVETAMQSWRAMSVGQRQAMTARFKQFFELNDQEVKLAIQTLPSDDRQRIERAFQSFERLPKDERDRALAGFQKFLALRPEEREVFLQNLAQWQNLTPLQRSAIRRSMEQFPALPPMPPGFLNSTVSSTNPSKIQNP